MQLLTGKKILFLGPKFFGYELEIKEELENQGAKVVYFDERPKNDFFTKLIIRLRLKNIIRKRIDNYYNDILHMTRNEEFDYLFLVNPETINVRKIERIKSLHKNIAVHTYMWDSIRNKREALKLLCVSNKFFTFDSSDILVDEKIQFLPLFYTKDFETIGKSGFNNEFEKYDISFVGSLHSDRYATVKLVSIEGFKTFYYFYSPSRILFFLQSMFSRDYRGIPFNEVSFTSLRRNEVVNIIKNSRSILDIEHPLQNGLTMRTIEIMGAKKKLVTTNKNIKNYDFYDERNILVIDRNNPQVSKEFFDSNYKELKQDVYEKYSLKSWIKTIFA